jgi:hypothetical protein
VTRRMGLGADWARPRRHSPFADEPVLASGDGINGFAGVSLEALPCFSADRVRSSTPKRAVRTPEDAVVAGGSRVARCDAAFEVREAPDRSIRRQKTGTDSIASG